jgi:hypothetical protein
MSGNDDLQKTFGEILAQMEADPDGPTISSANRQQLMDAIAHPKAAAEIQRGFELEAASVQEGQPAFDFTLPRLGAGGNEPQRSVTLSDHFGRRPVALVFGSYT